MAAFVVFSYTFTTILDEECLDRHVWTDIMISDGIYCDDTLTEFRTILDVVLGICSRPHFCSWRRSTVVGTCEQHTSEFGHCADIVFSRLTSHPSTFLE